MSIDPTLVFFAASLALGIVSLLLLRSARPTTPAWRIVVVACAPVTMLMVFYASLEYEKSVASRTQSFEHWKTFESVRQLHGAFVVLASFALFMMLLAKRRQHRVFGLGACLAGGALLLWMLALLVPPYFPG